MTSESRKVLPEYVFYLVSAYLCALGLSLFLIQLTGVTTDFSVIKTAFFCLLGFLVLVGIEQKPRLAAGLAATLVLPAVLLLLFTDLGSFVSTNITKFFIWLPPFLGESATHRPAFETALYILLLLVPAILCFLTNFVLRSIFLSFSAVVLPVLFITIFTRRDLPLAFLIPAVLGLFLMMMLSAESMEIPALTEDKERKGFLLSLPLILSLSAAGLVGVIIFSSFVPSSTLRRKEVANMTDDTLSFLNIPLPDSTNRKIFNLGGLGFYPLSTRLGGPVSIQNDHVLSVTASNDLLLRGVTYNIYSGQYWSSTNSILSSRFDSDALSDKRTDLFDAARPRKDLIPADLYYAVFEDSEISVTSLGRITGGTLFTPDHLVSIAATNRTPYYSQSGEVYLRDGVDPGQTYKMDFTRFKMSSLTYRADLLKLEAYLTDHPEARDSENRLQFINENYLSIHPTDTVRAYALGVTEGKTTPLEKVFALKDDLVTNFTYSLDVTVPPENSDFVEYFLSTKEGYCTYFASAMAVMARINGIPSRYVEGFVADVPERTIYYDPQATPPPGNENSIVTNNGVISTPENVISNIGNEYSDDTGAVVSAPTGESTIVVTGKMAHAWCEVYIDGIGWIPIDATAGSSGDGLSFIEEMNRSVQISNGDYADDPNANGYIPPHDITDRPEDIGSARARADRTGFAAVLLVLFPLCPVLWAVATVEIRRRRFCSAAARKNAVLRRPPQEILPFLFGDVLYLLSMLRIYAQPSESPKDYAERVRNVPVYITGCKRDTYSFDIKRLAELYERQIYGGKIPSEEEILAMLPICSDLTTSVMHAHRSPVHFCIRLLLTRERKK